MTIRIGFKTSPQDVDWATVDATWSRAGELTREPGGGFDSGWLNDHLTDMDPDVPGSSLEALTLLATLVHHVPGLTVGHAVLSNTFRHPVLLAKAATVLDHATDGQFVLGLGAGWFEGEHEPFGIELPPIGPRIDRLVSAVDTFDALFSAAAAAPPGVTRDDPFYPLRGAVNVPAPRTPGGPPIYLGGQGPRGIRLAARAAAGWLLPGTHAGNVEYFAAKRDELVAALEAAGRDPARFDIVGQVGTGSTAASRQEAVAASFGLVRAGATHIVLGMPAALGPRGLEAVAAECLAPLREQLG
ncbi:MAG: LLM class flavin-dependent oxidoreductase [Chloroflexi bacterium]|nr:LLM class flavin-dependent oxidoreductase [Chloroflexota bacterium]